MQKQQTKTVMVEIGVKEYIWFRNRMVVNETWENFMYRMKIHFQGKHKYFLKD
jgi:hypothetical protein